MQAGRTERTPNDDEVRSAMAAFFTTRARPAWWVTATPKRVVGEWGVQGSMRWFVGEVERRAQTPVGFLWVLERGAIMANPHGHLLLGSGPGICASWLERRWGPGWDIEVAEYEAGGGAATYALKQLDTSWFEYDFGFPAERPCRRARGGRRGRPGWRRSAPTPSAGDP